MGHHQPFIHFFSRLPAERVDDFPSGFFEGDLRSLVRHHFPCFFRQTSRSRFKRPWEMPLRSIKIISDMPKMPGDLCFSEEAKLANFLMRSTLPGASPDFWRKGLPVVPCAKQSVSVQISIFLDPCFPFFWKPCWAQYLNVEKLDFPKGSQMDLVESSNFTPKNHAMEEVVLGNIRLATREMLQWINRAHMLQVIPMLPGAREKHLLHFRDRQTELLALPTTSNRTKPQ